MLSLDYSIHFNYGMKYEHIVSARYVSMFDTMIQL